ncbi:MAG: sporulation transcriptional regulator SpoIIID [Firmicutes bacterium]|nr:sporulation transcriptional regulator SpoIIID [Bacillota bacterium]
MKDYIQKRVLDLSYYIAERKATVRQTAKFFGVSKSTVHKDVTERLPNLNHRLFQEVKLILQVNKAERHLRGGEATRKKYQIREMPLKTLKKGGYSKKT